MEALIFLSSTANSASVNEGRHANGSTHGSDYISIITTFGFLITTFGFNKSNKSNESSSLAAFCSLNIELVPRPRNLLA